MDQQYSTSVTLPLNTSNGQFTLVARFNGTEAYGDVLGYFNTITPNSGAHRSDRPCRADGCHWPDGTGGSGWRNRSHGSARYCRGSGSDGSAGRYRSCGRRATGAAGANGATGPTGAAGADGLDGNTVLNGTGAPANTLGFDGDFYVDLATTTLYGPKAAGAWPLTGVSLVGPTGATGATGAAGADGATGATGRPVPIGRDGASRACGSDRSDRVPDRAATRRNGATGLSGTAGVVTLAGTVSGSNTSNKTASATCGGATPRVLGGGYVVLPSTVSVYPTSSYPSSSTTWTVTVANGVINSTSWSLTAWALCAP